MRPEYVRLIRKNRPVTDGLRQTNLFHGEIVGERDEGTTWVLFFRLSRPGEPSQGAYDLEIEIPKLVYERLSISTDRHWDVSIHPGSIQVLPGLTTRPTIHVQMSRMRNGWCGVSFRISGSATL